jgi:hyperosmotically inducible protein
MKALIASVVCTAALIVTGVVSSAARLDAATAQVKAATSDKMLDERIEKRLRADATLKKYDIDVKVDGGVATLTGTVATEADRSKAETLAHVNGVTRVDNKLMVDLSAGTKGTAGTIKDKTVSGTEKVYDKTKEGTKAAYGKTKEGVSKTGEVINDTWITTKVKADMVNEDLLKDSDIEVHTTNHIVTLSGTVLSPAGRARAVAIAKGTDGVKRVVDKITIGPKK